MKKAQDIESLNCLDIYREDIEAMYSILRSAAKGGEIVLEAMNMAWKARQLWENWLRKRILFKNST